MKNQHIVCLAVICLILSAFLGGLYIGRNIGSDAIHTARLTPVTTAPPKAPETNPTDSQTPAVSPSESEVSGKININTATADRLASLPGIGPVLADSIVTYREKNGRFRKPEDLMNVSGIGQKRFDSIKDHITVGR